MMRLSAAAMLAVAALVLAGCGSRSGTPARHQAASSAARNPSASLPPDPEIASGFRTDLSKHSVPLSEFQVGGPGKDGIPALDSPNFAPVRSIDFVKDKEPVIELAVARDVRAYPIQILVWHEIVNDRVGGVPVAVTFCPLCNTAIVFDRRVDGRTLSFGTTGNLRNSDLVMFDRQTESWWQQFGGEALVGKYTGTQLRQLPARIVSWSSFRKTHPNGLVLTRHTGFSRPYGNSPYLGYDDVSSPPFFPAAHQNDTRLRPKERVVFLERGRDVVVVPFSTLARRHVVDVTVDGHRLVVRWRAGVHSSVDTGGLTTQGRDVGAAQVTENGRLVTFDEPFWFAVAAFRPHVRIVR